MFSEWPHIVNYVVIGFIVGIEALNATFVPYRIKFRRSDLSRIYRIPVRQEYLLSRHTKSGECSFL